MLYLICVKEGYESERNDDEKICKEFDEHKRLTQSILKLKNDTTMNIKIKTNNSPVQKEDNVFDWIVYRS